MMGCFLDLIKKLLANNYKAIFQFKLLKQNQNLLANNYKAIMKQKQGYQPGSF
jgi:hypothetical protein